MPKQKTVSRRHTLFFENPGTTWTTSEDDVRLGWLWDQLPLTVLLASLDAVQRKLKSTKAERLSWPASVKSLTLIPPASNSMWGPLIKPEQKQLSSLTVNTYCAILPYTMYIFKSTVRATQQTNSPSIHFYHIVHAILIGHSEKQVMAQEYLNRGEQRKSICPSLMVRCPSSCKRVDRTVIQCIWLYLKALICSFAPFFSFFPFIWSAKTTSFFSQKKKRLLHLTSQ